MSPACGIRKLYENVSSEIITVGPVPGIENAQNEIEKLRAQKEENIRFQQEAFSMGAYGFNDLDNDDTTIN